MTVLIRRVPSGRLAVGGNPAVPAEHALLVHIAALHRIYEAGDYEMLATMAAEPNEVAVLAGALRDFDRYLTDKIVPTLNHYEDYAEQILIGGMVVVHLADGGYSRLGIGITQSAHPWLDEGASTAKVVARWRTLG